MNPMRIFTTSLAVITLAATLPTGAAGEEDSTRDKVVSLAPLTVRPSYATINVGFVLSGTNLFNPAEDPILEARVSSVQATGDEGADPLQPQDLLLAVNGRELRGLTLRQIATVVQDARRQQKMIWRVRRGLAVFEVRQSGTWEPPLPGLER